MSILSGFESFLMSHLTTGNIAERLEKIIETALLKACHSIAASAKAGTLPESLKPFAPILEFLAEAAEEVLTPKPVA